MSQESYEFKAEIQQLLHILVHSLYTEREIFVRELISNAADALNRVQFEMLTNRDVLDPDAELGIHLTVDEENKTITISDTGIGMTRAEMVENLGTIAQSGAAAFVERLQQARAAQEEQEGAGEQVPALEVIGQITLVGDKPGMGQAVKHCNQLLVTAIHAATIELITLAEKTGADPKLVCEVVGSGIGGNDYFRLLSKAILENTASPRGSGQLWKDVNIIVTTAREHNLPLLTTFSTAQYFNMAVAKGMENEDAARLIDIIRKMIEP